MERASTAADLAVHDLADDEEGGRQGQGDDERHGQDAVLVGRGGLAAAVWVGNDAGVVGGEGLRQLVLLTPLQEEEVEALLDLLLTLDGEQVVLLTGSGGELAHGHAMGGLDGIELGVERQLRVVERLENGTAQVVQTDIEVADEGVLLAGVGDKVVALEDAGVV